MHSLNDLLDLNTNADLNADLNERMKASSERPTTRADIDKQRVSFIYGAVNSDSNITRAQIEEALNIGDSHPLK